MVEAGSPAISITAADTDTTIYKRTAGRRFILRSLTISNRAAALARVRLWDGPSAEGRVRVDLQVAAGEAVAVTDLRGITFEFGDVVGQSTQVPVDVQVGGFEE